MSCRGIGGCGDVERTWCWMDEDVLVVCTIDTRYDMVGQM